MRLDLASSLLLSLAVAACSDDGLPSQSSGQAPASTSGSSGSTGEDPTAGSTGPTSAGTSAGTSTTAADSTGEPTTGSDTGGTSGTTGDGTTTSGDPTDGTGEDPGIACAAGCAVEFACGKEWASEADCVAWCEANLQKAAAFSPYCRDAWAGVSACLATLTCEEFAQWQSPAMFPYPCSDADVVLQVECKGQ